MTATIRPARLLSVELTTAEARRLHQLVTAELQRAEAPPQALHDLRTLLYRLQA